MGMQLTEENYYSDIANYEYMSVSQFKDFNGTYGKAACEAAAVAKLKGTYKEPKSTALLIGSYVDRYFEGTLESYKKEEPAIFKKDGKLKAEYIQADALIKRAERDELFMKYMSGKKQVIMTAELYGTPWKIKMDSYIPGWAIVDLKVVESLTKMKWVRDIGYLDFVLQCILWCICLHEIPSPSKLRTFFPERISFYGKPNVLHLLHLRCYFIHFAVSSSFSLYIFRV